MGFTSLTRLHGLKKVARLDNPEPFDPDVEQLSTFDSLNRHED
jgi:hypothetical protein